MTSSHKIGYAAQILRGGGVVAIPTETVYGLAANALDLNAVAKVFALKKRPAFNPLIVHLAPSVELDEYAEAVPDLAYELAEAFWPGPLTILIPKKAVIPNLVTAGSSLCAFRKPAHPVAMELLELLDFPLAAPSANKYQAVSPTRAEHVAQAFSEEDLYILNGGSCERGLESTIVQIIDNKIKLLRLGTITADALVEYGQVVDGRYSGTQAILPGSDKKHYAPSKPFQIEEAVHPEEDDVPTLYLTFQPRKVDPPHLNISLSEGASLTEAAARLYDVLHQAGELDCERIVAVLLPEQGLGAAINDRLRRAAGKG